MTGTKISAYGAISDVEDDDLLVVVDVHDTTDADSGTTKNMTLSQLPFDASGAAAAAQTAAESFATSAVATETGRAETAEALKLAKASNLADLASIPAARHTLAPWLFDVTQAAYGAVGDGQVVVDGAMSSSSNPTHLACTTSTPFTSGDVGKHIIVNGAGADATTALVTTVASFIDSGHVVLADACSTTVSGAAVLWASDDTAAFQSAITAAAAYAAVHGYARVYRPPAPGGVFYGIAGALVTTGSANSQLTIPNPTATNAQCTLEFYAEQGPSVLNMWTQTAEPQALGAVVSFGIFGSAGDYVTNYGSDGPAAVLGTTPASPELLSDVDSLPAFANINVVVRNWTTVRPQSTNGLGYTGVNLGGASKGLIEHSASLLTANYSVDAGANAFPAISSFQNAECRGFILPGNGNNDQAMGRNLTCSGDAFGIQCGEHAYLENPKIVGVTFAFQLSANDGAANGHLVKIVAASVEDADYGFWIVGNGQSGVGFFIDAEIDVETLLSGGLIQDNNSGDGLASLFGEIRVAGQHELNIYPTSYPTSVKLKCMGGNGGQAPGYVSGYTGFSDAGTGVAVQNPYWRDVEVHFSGGTISVVKAGATLGGSAGSASTAPSMIATGLSGSGTVRWPSGGWLSFTFTGSPVWNVDVPA